MKTTVNPVGIQYLSRYMTDNVLGPGVKPITPSNDLIQASKAHLSDNLLLGKKTSSSDPINFSLPKLQGKSLDEHFFRIGREISEPYLSNALKFAQAGLPPQPKPSEWIRKSGWIKYEQGQEPHHVAYPDEQEALVLDTEVLYKISEFAVMCVAVSSKAWYCWLSPWLLGETDDPRQLIPLGWKEKKMVIGHNVCYDRKRIKDEYHLEKSNSFFLDTMSLHVATNGMCSHQRPAWIKTRKSLSKAGDAEDDIGADENLDLAAEGLMDLKENPWMKHSSLNNLHDVASFHCGVKLDKKRREYFGELDRDGVLGMLNDLIDYCATDVDITYRVFCKTLPRFLDVCPHPVSFAALGQLSSVFLPINSKWEQFIRNAESIYQENEKTIYEQLKSLAEQACKLKDKPEEYNKDPWLSQLDWTIKPLKMVKGKRKGDPERPAARQKLPGMPQWYRDLFRNATSDISITIRSRVTPRLLRLQWDGAPLIWSDIHGWIFRVDSSDSEKLEAYIRRSYVKCSFNEDPNIKFRDDKSGTYFRIPHKDGAENRCTNPMAKGYISHFEQGVLTSEYDYAKKAIYLNAQSSYWTSSRDRISKQMPVYSSDIEMGIKESAGQKFGMILPKIIPMGTITRRAVEDSWLTASNAKKDRIGSELKAMIQAPPGYKFVGADVDSEELWIASLIGDALFGVHGGSALGWMTLEGSKNEGTDLHSKTASILGISRNQAKVFNYGRIYGAGLKFAIQLLRQFNPLMSQREAQEVAEKLYQSTKGAKHKSKVFKKTFWRGGSESVVFNMLEDISGQDLPRTPVLGAGITEALHKKNLKQRNYLTSRVNWSIQSSGVDYLHLLICSMDHLIKQYGIRARLSLTVHDEIRYLVDEKDQYKASLALQIANLWTRALFCQQLGFTDIPQSVAFFSLVDIDHVLRKEVDLDCVTPSNPEPITPGIAIDIRELLLKCPKLTRRPNSNPPPDYSVFEYKPRSPVFDEISSNIDINYLKVQLCSNANEAKLIEQQVLQNSRGRPSKPIKPRAEATTKNSKVDKSSCESEEALSFSSSFSSKPAVYSNLQPRRSVRSPGMNPPGSNYRQRDAYM